MADSAQEIPGLSSSSEPAASAQLNLLEEWAKAFEAGDLKAMESVLSQGFDVNQKFENNLTTLFYAVYLGKTAIVKFLLEKNAIVDENTKVAAEMSKSSPEIKNTIKKMIDDALKKQPYAPEPANSGTLPNILGTKLHKVIHEAWGNDDWLRSSAFAYFIKLADAEHAKKTKTGFELMMNGKKVSWNAPTQQSPEMVTGVSRGFDQSSADAMVALARLRGWRTMNVHGTTEQKDMLWLSIQRQNRLDQEAFENGQKNGTIPLKDGKPIEYTPLTVGNYKPAADSPAMQAYLREQAEYDALHAPPAAITPPEEVAKPAAPAEPAKDETPAPPPATPSKFIAPAARAPAQAKETTLKPKKKTTVSKTRSQFQKSATPKPKKKAAAKCKCAPKSIGK